MWGNQIDRWVDGISDRNEQKKDEKRANKLLNRKRRWWSSIRWNCTSLEYPGFRAKFTTSTAAYTKPRPVRNFRENHDESTLRQSENSPACTSKVQYYWPWQHVFTICIRLRYCNNYLVDRWGCETNEKQCYQLIVPWLAVCLQCWNWDRDNIQSWLLPTTGENTRKVLWILYHIEHHTMQLTTFCYVFFSFQRTWHIVQGSHSKNQIQKRGTI